MGLFDNFKSLFSSGVDIRQRFELLREETAGTMSKCYKARDRKTGEVVALKLLDPKKTAEFEARFKGLHKPPEGEIARKLDHRYIVKTLEHGQGSKGEIYVVMEYLEGDGLHKPIRAGGGELEGKRLPLLRCMAEALAYMHTAGYIHRDVCPRNFVGSADLTTCKLIDFGLTVPATPHFMQPGNRTGEPNYMAPEIVRRQPTDQRVDVFAFGVSAYELCTGQLPWQRGTTGQIAMLHATEPPKPITDYRPQLQSDLAEAIMKCLAREPADRFASLNHFLQAIRGVEREDVS